MSTFLFHALERRKAFLAWGSYCRAILLLMGIMGVLPMGTYGGVIHLKKNGLLLEQQGMSLTLSGTVTDAEQQPLAGVSVLLKGSQIGTVTNGEGFFKLTVSPDQGTLLFSYVGFISKEVAFDRRKTTIHVQLLAEEN